MTAVLLSGGGGLLVAAIFFGLWQAEKGRAATAIADRTVSETRAAELATQLQAVTTDRNQWKEVADVHLAGQANLRATLHRVMDAAAARGVVLDGEYLDGVLQEISDHDAGTGGDLPTHQTAAGSAPNRRSS
jgi:hypothetical protein